MDVLRHRELLQYVRQSSKRRHWGINIFQKRVATEKEIDPFCVCRNVTGRGREFTGNEEPQI